MRLEDFFFPIIRARETPIAPPPYFFHAGTYGPSVYAYYVYNPQG